MLKKGEPLRVGLIVWDGEHTVGLASDPELDHYREPLGKTDRVSRFLGQRITLKLLESIDASVREWIRARDKELDDLADFSVGFGDND